PPLMSQTLRGSDQPLPLCPRGAESQFLPARTFSARGTTSPAGRPRAPSVEGRLRPDIAAPERIGTMFLPALRGGRAFTSRLAGRGRRKTGDRPRFFRPRLEPLEDRWVLSTVINNFDSGTGSLRDAILNAA